jgi:chromosome segregation ATPase
MARSGIYISDVKRARDSLIAQGLRPSIDAVRAALGNTGSKSTIHKYMRELDAEEGAAGQPLSAAIQELVFQLAEQLEREAAVEAESLRAQLTDRDASHDRERTALEARLVQAQKEIQAISLLLKASEQDLATVGAQLHAEQIARHKAEQHSQDVSERLADAQRHQASLEEKHRHARDALDHYRSSAKEQREQEARRQEQQVQGLQTELRQAELAAAVKQEDLTRLNREAASLVSDLASARQALHAEKEANRKLALKVERLQGSESRVAVLEAQLAESRARTVSAEEAAARATEEAAELRQRNVVLEIELANAKSTLTLEERLAKLDKAILEAANVSQRGTSPT